MYTQQLALFGGLATLSGLVSAAPCVDSLLPDLFKRATISPDNTCGTLGAGAGNNYTCVGTTIGSCCSQNGWCGSTIDYCGTGCQSAFGNCTIPVGDPTPIPDPTQCGPANANQVCSTGKCCSQAGWCGTTTDYCGTGCQSGFGNCTVGTGDGSGGTTPPSDNNICGPANNNQTCSAGFCCSPAGFCGTTEDYCMSPGCLTGFGTCDSDKTPSGASTATIPRPVLGNIPFGSNIFDCNDPGHIGITFDDGPYIYTSDMLDLLASYNVKATFFITGINNGKGAIDDETLPWPAIIRRMITDGHQVASHTWSHADLSTLNETARELEMVKNEMAFRNIIGKFPTWMRPPYSSCDDACLATMKRLGYHVTYFDLDTQDYLHTTPETNQISKDVVHVALSTADPTDSDFLSIAHDIHEQTVHNLTGYMLDQMVLYGFKGVPAGTCIGDPEANWYRSAGGAVSSPTSSSTVASSTTSPTISTTSSRTSSSFSSSSTSSSTSTKPTSTVRPTSTTSTLPTPTGSSCKTFAVGSWCAGAFSFSTKLGCLTSALTCEAGLLNSCVATRGNSLATCQKGVIAECTKLNTYCARCPLLGGCQSSGFKY